MRKNLTDKAVRGLKPEDGRYDVWDPAFTGGAFGVRVAPSGLKTFIFMGRDRDGRKRRVTLGSYPEMSLSEARQAAREKAVDLARGMEPDRPGGPTFGDLAAEFLRIYPRMKGIAPKTLKEWTRILKADLLPVWENKPLPEIRRGDVSRLLDRIAFERNSPVMANRILGLCSVIFNFAIDTGRFGIEVNPCYRMARRVVEMPRDRVLTDDEIRAVWAESARRTAGGIYRLMLLTGQRSGEIKAMRWTDMEDDVWTIPAKVAKNGREHRVPLSDQALALLKEQRRESGRFDSVFPSRKADGPLRSVKKTTQRMQDALGFDFRPHDLRRTVATRLARLGFEDSTIGRVLNHAWAFREITRRVYVVDDRLPEKREALQRWANELDRILEEGQEAKKAVS